LKIHL